MSSLTTISDCGGATDPDRRPCGQWQFLRQISPGRPPYSVAFYAADPSRAYVFEKKNNGDQDTNMYIKSMNL